VFVLDDVDLKIIEILKKDSRTPYTEVASAIGVSDSTIHVRLKKLKDEEVLLRYTIEINEEYFGKKVQGLVMINVSLGHLEEVISGLMIINNIDKIFETHGVNDIVALIYANDLDDLRQVLMEIRKIENVSSTELTTILNVWK
jgi:Lrp/AsnC family transcriptional regulator for asnA, asnC and gidA